MNIKKHLATRDMKWEMRNGEKIAISDMTDSHLRNTIAMLKRSWKKLECREHEYERSLTRDWDDCNGMVGGWQLNESMHEVRRQKDRGGRFSETMKNELEYRKCLEVDRLGT